LYFWGKFPNRFFAIISFAAAKLYPNVACDENGMPIGCTVPEWFDKLDKKLIEHFGEEYRQLANKRRRKDNQRGLWKFEML
jgi:hypothetical protein